MDIAFGERIAGLRIGGRELEAPVFNENEVRAAAGLTLVIGATAFCFAIFEQVYVPLQIVTAVFFVEFLVRLTIGLKYGPVGALAHLMTRSQPPDWVSAKPKRFAWRLGLALALAMTIITNSGVRGVLPGTLCAICMTLMWMEAALGLCLGCKLHALLVQRGWKGEDAEIERCAHGVCRLPARTAGA